MSTHGFVAGEAAEETPVAAVDAGAAAVVATPVGSQADEPARDSGRPRVLVVEDSRTVATVVKYFLEHEGFEVLLAEDGLVGLETARRERLDLIVTDVNMPAMGGVDMVKALRLDARMSHVRILMLSSDESTECETEGLAAGADDYILKPVEPRRLAARVKALLSRSHHRAA